MGEREKVLKKHKDHFLALPQNMVPKIVRVKYDGGREREGVRFKIQ